MLIQPIYEDQLVRVPQGIFSNEIDVSIAELNPAEELFMVQNKVNMDQVQRIETHANNQQGIKIDEIQGLIAGALRTVVDNEGKFSTKNNSGFVSFDEFGVVGSRNFQYGITLGDGFPSTGSTSFVTTGISREFTLTRGTRVVLLGFARSYNTRLSSSGVQGAQFELRLNGSKVGNQLDLGVQHYMSGNIITFTALNDGTYTLELFYRSFFSGSNTIMDGVNSGVGYLILGT